jgi:hypothetical protein
MHIRNVLATLGAGFIGTIPLASIPASTTACSNGLRVECLADGSRCGGDGDCCSGFCGVRAGICCISGTEGNPENTPCVRDADCCTDLCASDGLCGCIPSGGAGCTVDFDCCTNLCVRGVCS